MTTADYIERIQAATAHRTAMRIQGAGTKAWYGQNAVGDILDSRGYSGIIDYDPSELVITARCGTLLSEIQRTLAEQRQMFAFEPPSFGDDATLGGMVASGLAGPRRASAGAVRDFVLGTVLLNGKGERLVFGGQVMKNVAGYDVSRLLTGSMGCLGLLLEISIKVLPMPRSEISLRFEMTQTQALSMLQRWAGMPLPLSASCWENQSLTLRLSGSEAATKAAHQQMGGTQITDLDAEPFWIGIREQTQTFFSQHTHLWRLSLPSTTPELNLGGQQLLEWGGAQRWLTGSTFDAQQLRQKIAAAGGHATLFKGGDKSCGVFQPLSAPLLTIHQRLKSAFDPAGIFNAGRLYPEF